LITEVPELNELADLTVLAYGSSRETLLATRLEAPLSSLSGGILGKGFLDFVSLVIDILPRKESFLIFQ